MTKQLWKWSFTWNLKDGWEEKQFREDHVKVSDVMKKYAKKWIFQLERGEKGRLHYQGYMSLLKKSTQGSLAKCIQTELEGFHLGPCSAVGEAALKTYCMKSDTKEAGSWQDKEEEAKNTELSKLFRQNCDFDPVEEYKDIREHPRAFQNQLRAMCDPSVTNRRNIIWVGSHDGTNGNIGKTHWANYMCDEFGAEFHTYGNSADIANVICQRPKSRVYIFNLPRSKPKEAALQELFNIMEQLKDGRVKNYKYNGGELKMRKPHVVVFANYFPTKLEALGMTTDRWKFYEISPEPYYQLLPTRPREKITNDHDESTSRLPM